MYVAAVTVYVKADRAQAFIEATLENARRTRQEVGNIRFDVLQAEDNPSRFLLYEVYHTKHDFASHQQTPHYLEWKRIVADWMARPREGVKHHSLFFGDGP